MEYSIRGISIENFKSYASKQDIKIADLSVFMGANSSGKSTALQVLLAIKQTMECNSRDIELLLSGKYVALGDFDDVIYAKNKERFSIGVDFDCNKDNESLDSEKKYRIVWNFEKAEDRFQASLHTIDILHGDVNVSMVRKADNKYQIIMNNEATPIFVHIRNLRWMNKIFLKYDVEFNRIYADFINDLKEVVEGKKTKKIQYDKFVSSQVSQEFYMNLLYDENIKKMDKEGDKKEIKIAETIVDLIEQFGDYQNPMGNGYLDMPRKVKSNCIAAVLKRTGKTRVFQEIYEKYYSLYNEYKEKDKKQISSYEGEETFFRYMIRDADASNIIDMFQSVGDFYDDFEEVIKNLFFVGPIRENPQGLYNIGFEQNPKYVGPTGINFASVLLHENKIKKYILPYDEEDEISLWEALNEWSAHLNIASAIEVSYATSFGIKVSVSDTQNKTADIMNVGIGTSQVLPVLITGLLSEEDEMLVFEQPELHLHPFSQSRLADFFVALINHGRKIIIETHSEAFILRLRYQILKGNCRNDSIAINFFQNKQGTKVAVCNISGYGNIQYPEDFRDETQELLNDLMNAALKKEYT